MPETNRDRLNRLGIADDYDALFDTYGDEICEVCREKTDMMHHLSPSNPACEGGWCDEATEIWLDEVSEEGN